MTGTTPSQMNEDSITYDASTDRYYVDISIQGPDTVADTIVFAIATITETDPITLPPLGDVVDTDALGSIFRTPGGDDPDVTVSFEYSGFLVTVHGRDRISFEERD